jgi:transposase-like protein
VLDALFVSQWDTDNIAGFEAMRIAKTIHLQQVGKAQPESMRDFIERIALFYFIGSRLLCRSRCNQRSQQSDEPSLSCAFVHTYPPSYATAPRSGFFHPARSFAGYGHYTPSPPPESTPKSKCAKTLILPAPDTTRPCSLSSTPTSKREAHPLSNRSITTQNRRHANDGTFLQGGIPHEPNRRTQKIVQTSNQTGNYCETARLWHTSPQLVRKWVKRSQQHGDAGLQDLPKPPKRQPRRTDTDIEQRVLQLHQQTRYGRRRLARHLAQQGIPLSPHTIRHILRRHAPQQRPPRKPRRRLYPAHWAWETQEPFTLIQADVKDLYDKGTLGTARWDHLRKHRLPRYQWTFLESRTRLRLIAYSHDISVLHGMAFLSLAVSWLRLCGVQTERTIQTDWGKQWGRSNPDKLARLEAQYLRPLGARLGRILLGRKE